MNRRPPRLAARHAGFDHRKGAQANNKLSQAAVKYCPRGLGIASAAGGPMRLRNSTRRWTAPECGRVMLTEPCRSRRADPASVLRRVQCGSETCRGQSYAGVSTAALAGRERASPGEVGPKETPVRRDSAGREESRHRPQGPAHTAARAYTVDEGDDTAMRLRRVRTEGRLLLHDGCQQETRGSSRTVCLTLGHRGDLQERQAALGRRRATAAIRTRARMGRGICLLALQRRVVVVHQQRIQKHQRRQRAMVSAEDHPVVHRCDGVAAPAPVAPEDISAFRNPGPHKGKCDGTHRGPRVRGIITPFGAFGPEKNCETSLGTAGLASTGRACPVHHCWSDNRTEQSNTYELELSQAAVTQFRRGLGNDVEARFVVAEFARECRTDVA